MCLGRSASNAGKIFLVWNLSTGYVSSQYHVVFDDNFSTFRCLTKSEAPPNWEQLVRDHSEGIDPECTDLDSTWNLQNAVDDTSSGKMRENMASNTIMWANE